MANWFIESSRKLQPWNATLYVVAAMHQKHVGCHRGNVHQTLLFSRCCLHLEYVLITKHVNLQLVIGLLEDTLAGLLEDIITGLVDDTSTGLADDTT